MKILTLLFACLISSVSFAANNVLNVFIWGNYLPDEVVHQFTKETKIKVNISEYENNETMYAKLKATSSSGYDIVVPSTYYVERMAKQGMLHKIDKTLLPNFKNLNTIFLNKDFDTENNYSVPYLWGTTGIIVNTKYFDSKKITSWQDLWDPKYRDQLMILDDMREVFAMAFLALGYPVNDTDPGHIKAAYLKLVDLLPNIKIFNIDAVPNIYIDEDMVIGMAWSGDCLLAREENPRLEYIYPQEGFTIWLDSLAIVANAPHLENAHKFINFLLRPEIAVKIIKGTGHSTPNSAAIKLLPVKMQKDPIFNPSNETLERGQFQTDIDSATLQAFEKYWEKLKVGG